MPGAPAGVWGWEVKERPIIMQAESVRAILDGRKTQTRRVLKHQVGTPRPTKDAGIWGNNCDPVTTYFGCPHGQPGDRLWVKEAFYLMPHLNAKSYFRATDPLVGVKWKSPLFMPRCASRITLELVNVRVERVQQISRSDVLAEGFDKIENETWPWRQYMTLWESIHGQGSWAANPLVWVLEFKRVTP